MAIQNIANSGKSAIAAAGKISRFVSFALFGIFANNSG